MSCTANPSITRVDIPPNSNPSTNELPHQPDLKSLLQLDIGWQEPSDHTQRIDINYTSLHGSGRGKLVSLDPSPRAEAQDRIVENGLSDYVELLAVPLQLCCTVR